MREKFENEFAAGGNRSRDPASSRVNGVEWRGIMWGLVLSCHWMHQKDGGWSKATSWKEVGDGVGSKNGKPDSNVAPIR